jgi:hypothetical protein
VAIGGQGLRQGGGSVVTRALQAREHTMVTDTGTGRHSLRRPSALERGLTVNGARGCIDTSSSPNSWSATRAKLDPTSSTPALLIHDPSRLKDRTRNARIGDFTERLIGEGIHRTKAHSSAWRCPSRVPACRSLDRFPANDPKTLFPAAWDREIVQVIIDVKHRPRNLAHPEQHSGEGAVRNLAKVFRDISPTSSSCFWRISAYSFHSH